MRQNAFTFFLILNIFCNAVLAQPQQREQKTDFKLSEQKDDEIDFRDYLAMLSYRIRRHHFSDMMGEKNIEIVFKIDKEGNIFDEHFEKSSGDYELDEKIWRAVDNLSNSSPPPANCPGFITILAKFD